MEGFALIALAIAAVVIGFFLIRQSKKKARGHRAADHNLPALPHVHARASQTHISGGRDVGRMDVPHRRLQG